MSGSQHNHDDEEQVEPTPIWRRRNVLIVGGIVAVALLFIFTRGKTPDKPQDVAKKDNYIGVVVPYNAPHVDPPPPPAPVKVAEAPPPPPPPTAPPAAPPPPPAPLPPAFRPQAMVPMMPAAQPKPPPRPVMLSYEVAPVTPPKPAPAPAEPPRTSLDFKTATLPGMKASASIDDTYQLMPGLLPCVLDTAIQSDLPGPFLAHLPGPVYSPKGVLLMEAGTQIIGRYESLGKSGSSRLMAVSTYAHTPNGIWVPLTGEPMADDLGRTGLDGAVNRHFVQKFGAAILMTLTQSALGIIQAMASSGGNTYLSLNSGGGGLGGVAQAMLQDQATIPDTFSKHQGETVALFLDQPIDFSDSYKIRSARQ